MRSRLILAALLVTAATTSPALAQQSQGKGGIPTETQRRMAQKFPIPWDLLGLFGLVGLLGLRSKHPDDSYHPTSLE